MYKRDTVSTILSIDASDNLGAFGMQADIKTAASFGVSCSSVVTGIISRDQNRIINITSISPKDISSQLCAVFDSFSPDAVKIGMLTSTEAIDVVAQILIHYAAENIVVDPVFKPQKNNGLNSHDKQLFDRLKSKLFPIASLVTPDFDEALAIASLSKLESSKDFGKLLYEKSGAKAVLLKGGDSKSEYCTDILFTGDDTRMFRQSRIPTSDTLGAGSVFTTAIACGLAKGFILPKAVRMAKDFITFAIQKGLDLGLSIGNGPLYIFNK